MEVFVCVSKVCSFFALGILLCDIQCGWKLTALKKHLSKGGACMVKCTVSSWLNSLCSLDALHDHVWRAPVGVVLLWFSFVDAWWWPGGEWCMNPWTWGPTGPTFTHLFSLLRCYISLSVSFSVSIFKPEFQKQSYLWISESLSSLSTVTLWLQGAFTSECNRPWTECASIRSSAYRCMLEKKIALQPRDIQSIKSPMRRKDAVMSLHQIRSSPEQKATSQSKVFSTVMHCFSVRSRLFSSFAVNWLPLPSLVFSPILVLLALQAESQRVCEFSWEGWPLSQTYTF